MSVDWASFTPAAAAMGGALIGLGVAMLLLLNGRVAGVSGILSGVMRLDTDTPWRVAFILGLVAAPLAYGLVTRLPDVTIATGPVTLVAAGFLVGIGTRYGAGCTSGHGICGISRLSPRSLVATAAFMGAGFATVYVVRHLVGAGA